MTTPLLLMLLGIAFLLFGILLLLAFLAAEFVKLNKQLNVLEQIDYQTLNSYLISALRHEL